MRTLAWVVAAAISLTACTSASSPPDPPELTVSYGCGFGFAIGDEQQRVGLVLTFLDFEAATAGDVDTDYVLPDPAWDADLTFGYDLFSNWCDDVIEPDEPEVVIQQSLPVTGRLVIESLPEPGTCGPATGTLFGAEYTSENDGTVSLGDIELTNDFWGCFAG
jgi:hypothetical protein